MAGLTCEEERKIYQSAGSSNEQERNARIERRPYFFNLLRKPWIPSPDSTILLYAFSALEFTNSSPPHPCIGRLLPSTPLQRPALRFKEIVVFTVKARWFLCRCESVFKPNPSTRDTKLKICFPCSWNQIFVSNPDAAAPCKQIATAKKKTNKQKNKKKNQKLIFQLLSGFQRSVVWKDTKEDKRGRRNWG